MLKNLLSTTALVAAVAVGAFAMPTVASADITIAVAGPMTGDLAAFGEQLRRGAEMAVKDINAAGGVNGEQIKLEIGDDQCDPKQAVQVANDLVKKGVAFVAGHFCSGSSIPASEVYMEEGVLQMTPASTNPAFTEGPASKGVKTIFRTCGRDDKQGSFAGPWMAKHLCRQEGRHPRRQVRLWSGPRQRDPEEHGSGRSEDVRCATPIRRRRRTSPL